MSRHIILMARTQIIGELANVDIPRFFENFDLVSQLIAGYRGLLTEAAICRGDHPIVRGEGYETTVKSEVAHLQEIGSRLWQGIPVIVVNSHERPSAELSRLFDLLEELANNLHITGESVEEIIKAPSTSADPQELLLLAATVARILTRDEQIGLAQQALGRRTNSTALVQEGEAQIYSTKIKLQQMTSLVKRVRIHEQLHGKDREILFAMSIETPILLKFQRLDLIVFQNKVMKYPPHTGLGITAEELTKWRECNFDPVTTAYWSVLTLDPNDAIQWQRAEFLTPIAAASWICRGFTLNEACRWQGAGVSAAQASCLTKFGLLDIEHASEVAKMFPSLESLFEWHLSGGAAIGGIN